MKTITIIWQRSSSLSYVSVATLSVELRASCVPSQGTSSLYSERCQHRDARRPVKSIVSWRTKTSSRRLSSERLASGYQNRVVWRPDACIRLVRPFTCWRCSAGRRFQCVDILRLATAWFELLYRRRNERRRFWSVCQVASWGCLLLNRAMCWRRFSSVLSHGVPRLLVALYGYCVGDAIVVPTLRFGFARFCRMTSWGRFSLGIGYCVGVPTLGIGFPVFYPMASEAFFAW
jgi:hypothetical protein